MSINFKIYFKDLEKKVLAKGNFDNFDWKSLRDIIIVNSKKQEFSKKNKELRDRDDFILEFIELPKNFNFSLTSIWDTKTYNYFLENLKAFIEKNKGEEIKSIRMGVVKVKDLPKWDLPKYDSFLKNILESTWKIEEEKIKKKLNNQELNNGKDAFTMNNNKNAKNEEMKNNNLICNSCFSFDFSGQRYVCTYCKNYNLCKKCYYLGEHEPEHNFILFKKPFQDSHINKYNNIFRPSTVVLRNIYDDSFEVNFKVANTGEKDLQNCYLANIKFTGKYLYCDKYIIKEKLLKNECTDIKLRIHFNESEDKIGLYEGHFRMFNDKGEPFGDILKIRVKNNLKN